MYLLDTDTCIYILNEPKGVVHKTFLSKSPQEIKLCSVVKAELFFGARNSEKVEANLNLLDQFFAPLRSLEFEDRAAEEYGLIRADLIRQGKPIGPNDLLIAAIARSHDCVLVTNNTKEFSRIVGLRLENWMR